MSIQVTNLVSGSTVTYSLPILVGEVTPHLSQGHLKVTCCSEGRPRLWPIHNGQFKVLVPLQKGQNKIELHFFDETVDFILHYRVPTIKKYVRPIYIKPCDDSGHFQGPEGEDTSVEGAVRRIALAAKLIQSFTAEKLHEHGLGRKTFVLESDLFPSDPPCHVFKSKMNLKRARETAGGDLWMSFARELMSSKTFKEKDNVKWYAFMSFTYYAPPEGIVPKSHSEVIRYTQGHTALGGGGLALFGTGNLHTWAANLDEFVPRFTDTRKIDRSKLMDDSAYRQYNWANYSTGLGASLHELGHTFDLAHTPTGIMSRGFDDIYRTFLAQPMAVSRGSLSRDSSRLASPIPYSPKESPIRRPKRRESLNEPKSGSRSRSSSPKPCALSRPPQGRSGVAMMPSVIQIETAFRRVSVENIQTLVVHNYDGSKTKKTITRNRDGTETISEVTTYPDGKQSAREIIKHLASGKTRTTMSMSTSVESLHSLKDSKNKPKHSSESQSNDISKINPATGGSSAHNTSQSSPVRLTNAPNQGADSSMSFQEIKYKDGGAHWYRSSAVMLSSHKWFNEPDKSDPHKPPEVSGGTVCAAGDRGLRIVELRSLPEGVVFHHWEFPQDQPPTAFELRHSEIMQLSHNAEQITVVAEDDYGNIVKKKVLIADLEQNDHRCSGNVFVEDAKTGCKSTGDVGHPRANGSVSGQVEKRVEITAEKTGQAESFTQFSTTSKSTAISENILSSGDSSRILVSGFNPPENAQVSYQKSLTETDAKRENGNISEISSVEANNHGEINSKGQHSSQETAETIQGTFSDSTKEEKTRGTAHLMKEGNHQVEENKYRNNDKVLSNVSSNLENVAVQDSSSITENVRSADQVVEVLANGVDGQSSDGEAMKSSTDSQDSRDVVNGVQADVVGVREVENLIDNFNRNVALQQTVESNRSEQEGNEMIDSFHLENGNTNI